ncbi:MAG: TonB-dependent receptor [Caulobacter sp.]|nr:TonB-dependent receptor [Caulobacter sp.]
MAMSLGAAASASAQAQPTQVDEVVITGSLIAGTPEDAALPVDVIGSDEIQKQGSPTTVELIKSLSVSSGVLGDTNQFDARAQGSEGSGSVNLRGLGSARTLVLLNGRRLPINPFGAGGSGIVDTNTIPSAAIGRIEVLKDGAAVTYGSDAIAGVVNFITKTNYDGLELGATYKSISGSDGDYGAHLNWGMNGDNSNFFLSLAYSHKSELSVAERDWANLPYDQNPEGGWSAAGSPASFVPLASSANRFRDSQCGVLGGFAGYSGTPGATPLGVTPVCYWHYTPFDNLVEEETRYQAFGSADFDLAGDTTLHTEFSWTKTEVPKWRTSPSYALLSTPTASVGSVLNNYFIPSTNPGLVAYRAAHLLTGWTATNSVTAASSTRPETDLAAGALLVGSRPFGMGGNPMFDYGSSGGSRGYAAVRFSASLDGKFNDSTNWNLSVTYGSESAKRTGYDTIVNRYQLALRGYGSLNNDGNGGCTAGETANFTTNAGNAALGCYYFNPFSSAIPSNVMTGQTTPQYSQSLANSPELARWFFQELKTEQEARLLVVEGVVSGVTGWTLGGGDVAWALGGQYRENWFKSNYNDLSNRNLFPCIDTITSGNMVCTNRNGIFAFLAPSTPQNLNNDLYAVFGELSLPVTDNIQVQLAARYEDYGGETGSTFDPKIAVRWQVNDVFAMRASASSTFRAPPTTALTNDFGTSLQAIAGVFRAVDIYGNPDLEPETANTFSVGAMVDVGNFKATIDYWSFDFANPIVTDPVSDIVAAVFPNGQGPGNNCAEAAVAPLVARFTFTGNVCSATNIQRLRVNTVNGAPVKTSGVDVLADYDFGDFLGGDLSIGTSITWVREYQVGATSVDGVLVSAAYDAVGLLNYQKTSTPLPQLKGDFHIEWSTSVHNLRWTTRYIDSYTDQRTAPFAANAYRREVYTDTFTVANGKEIESTFISDLTYRARLPGETTLVISVDNLFDADPAFARLDLNYDPFTGDPLGRTFKFSLTKQF